MRRLLALCGGFLLAVLWFDLMFDVQALGAPEGPLAEPVLTSIAGYYARVTGAAQGRLVGLVMLVTIAAAVHQLVRGTLARVWAAAALAACVPPIGLALFRVFPNAVRLGARSDTLDVQSALARSILQDHLVCIALILVFCAIQLFGRDREA
jgi:hypothetical protein